MTMILKIYKRKKRRVRLYTLTDQGEELCVEHS